MAERLDVDHRGRHLGAGILVFAPISLGSGLHSRGVLFVIIAVLLVLSTPSIVVTGDP